MTICKAADLICSTNQVWYTQCCRTLRQNHGLTMSRNVASEPRIATDPDRATQNSPNFVKASHSAIRRYQQCHEPNNRPAHNQQWMHHSCPMSSLKPPQSLTGRSQTNHCDNSTASHNLPMGHGRLDKERQAQATVDKERDIRHCLDIIRTPAILDQKSYLDLLAYLAK